MTNNFVGLKLSNLEESLFQENYVLKLFRIGSNQRIVRLEDKKGNLIFCKEGISLIPTLERANNEFLSDNLCYKAPSYKVIDSTLDNYIIKGSKLIIKKHELYIRGVLKDWEDNVLLTKQSPHLMSMLVSIEHHLNHYA